MSLEPRELVFYLGSFVAPSILVILNFLVRKVKNWYYTAGSDFLLTLMTFSICSGILSEDMSPYIRNSYIRQASVAIFVVLGLIILVCWYWTVSTVEAQIHQAIRRRVAPTALPQGKLFVAWSFVVSFFALEILIFLHR